jgi:transcriptional regulator with XRE-family HTH domain
MVNQRDKFYARQLKKLRKKHKIKQLALYPLLNLNSQQQYSDLEQGKKHFTEDLTLKICTVFKIPVLDFITDKKNEESSDLLTYDRDINNLFKTANDKLKILLLKRLLIESKLESLDLKLKLYKPQEGKETFELSKKRVHVFV